MIVKVGGPYIYHWALKGKRCVSCC